MSIKRYNLADLKNRSLILSKIKIVSKKIIK